MFKVTLNKLIKLSGVVYKMIWHEAKGIGYTCPLKKFQMIQKNQKNHLFIFPADINK